MRPDYAGGSLVNLVASVVAARGGKPLHEPLRNFEFPVSAKNLVLLIIDGLGDNYLARHGKGSELERRRHAALTSVFPSTTASAITTSYTGRTPLATRGVSPDQIFTVPSLFGALQVQSIVVTHRDIIDSQYNSVHCRGAERVAYANADELVAQVERVVKASDERKFIYAYWPHYDAVSHRFGCESAQAAREFETVDAAFGALLRRLAGTDTVVVATSDHGFIDVAPEESLELPASLASLLRFPLCGER